MGEAINISHIWLATGVMAALVGGAVELLKGNVISFKGISISKKVVGFSMVVLGVVSVLQSYFIELKETQDISMKAIEAYEESKRIRDELIILRDEVSWKEFSLDRDSLKMECDYKLHVNNDAEQRSTYYPRMNLHHNLLKVSLSDHFDMEFYLDDESVKFIPKDKNAKTIVHKLSERVEKVMYRCLFQ